MISYNAGVNISARAVMLTGKRPASKLTWYLAELSVSRHAGLWASVKLNSLHVDLSSTAACFMKYADQQENRAYYQDVSYNFVSPKHGGSDISSPFPTID